MITSQIKAYSSLSTNWDTYNGIAPSDEVINRALDCVKWLKDNGVEVYYTAPSPNGDIVVEIRKGECSIEFEFGVEGFDLIIQCNDSGLVNETRYNENSRSILITYLKDHH